MGRQKNKYHQVTLIVGKLETDTDTDACTSKRAQPVSKTLKQLLDQLYEKRGSTREAALSGIIQIFSFGYQHKFAEQNFTELLYQFMKAFKRSSAKESCLGVEALGLLAINIGCGEHGLELYKESAPILSEALKTESNSKKLKLVLCLWSCKTSVLPSPQHLEGRINYPQRASPPTSQSSLIPDFTFDDENLEPLLDPASQPSQYTEGPSEPVEEDTPVEEVATVKPKIKYTRRRQPLKKSDKELVE